MTDLETLMAMFERAGVPYDHYERAEGHPEQLEIGPAAETTGPNVRGSADTLANFNFDESGRLLWVGVWCVA